MTYYSPEETDYNDETFTVTKWASYENYSDYVRDHLHYYPDTELGPGYEDETGWTITGILWTWDRKTSRALGGWSPHHRAGELVESRFTDVQYDGESDQIWLHAPDEKTCNDVIDFLAENFTP